MRRFKNLVGETIGNLIVTELLSERVKGNIAYRCVCVCGNTIIKQNQRLTAKDFSGHCGCKSNENKSKSAIKIKQDNLEGKVFGKLLVQNLGNSLNGLTTWNCICDCGTKCIVRANNLKTGTTNSCGCLQKETIIKNQTTHNLSKTPEYKTWCGMKQRCLNLNNPSYYLYGSKGIKVCDRWANSFENFIEDMGDKPTATSTIERLDSNKDYCKENCIWLEGILQARNTSRCVLNLDLAKRIRLLNSDGISGAEITRILNSENILASKTAVYDVINNQTWVN